MILDPSERRLYTDAVRPPAGHVFDGGLATTFTLDLTALLAIPLHLTLFARSEDPETLLGDSVGLLEALRQTTQKLQVYCHQGMIGVPQSQSPLYGLLESVVVEARAPRGGFFHPKFWILRFKPDGGGDPRLRLLVLSRNLTRDYAWDLLLAMEGSVRGRNRALNRSLSDLIARLPDLAAPGGREPDRELARSLSDEVARAEWEIPEPFEDVRFHALGLNRGGWKPPESQQLLVVSPYVTDRAIARLADTTEQPVALVSRLEELTRLRDQKNLRFGKVYHLNPIAIEEDSREARELLGPQAGFHAKAYVLQKGRHAHVIVGSANATEAGLEGANLELLVELIGQWKWVGKPEALLEKSGLIRMLQEYQPPTEPLIDEKEEKAAAELEKVRRRLIEAKLTVRCEEREGTWWMRLEAGNRFPAAKDHSEIASVRVWPITLHPEMGRDLFLLEPNEEVAFSSSLAALSGFFAFHIRTKRADAEIRFVLNLPIENMPEARYGAILRTVIANKEKFIRYLLLLLGTEEQIWFGAGTGMSKEFDRRRTWEDVALLEEIVRALCRDPDRLHAVESILGRLREEEAAKDVIPDGFLELWRIIREEMGEAS